MRQAQTSTNNLALCFGEVITAILRVRSGQMPLPSAVTLRNSMRRLLQGAMAEARALGYPNQCIQMGVLMTVGFFDESVLNLNEPSLAEWARRPLQEELFGGHLAGETIFNNIFFLLKSANSRDTVDTLELHCQCLQLGYRGRYALSGMSELAMLIDRCRSRIQQARGIPSLSPPQPARPEPMRRRREGSARPVIVTAVVLLAITLAAFTGYELGLAEGVKQLVQLTNRPA